MSAARSLHTQPHFNQQSYSTTCSSPSGNQSPPSPSATPSQSGHVYARSSSSSAGRTGLPGAGEHAFAHIDDLKADALAGYSPNNTITKLFAIAEESLRDAKFNIDYRKPDRAFVDYMRAYEIAVEVLPKHRDYIHFIHDQHGQQRLQLLQRRIAALDQQFASIKIIIQNNNSRFGVWPQSQQFSRRPQSRQSQLTAGSESILHESAFHKSKPPVSPKPQSLHARAAFSVIAMRTSSAGDTLSDRFEKLRLGTPSTAHAISAHSSNVYTPSVVDFGPSPSASSVTGTSRPQGPRGMPDHAVGTNQSIGLPLDTELAAAMPKAPSPTYSPAKMGHADGSIPPSRSVRGSASFNSHDSSLVVNSPLSSTAPTGGVDYFEFASANVSHNAHVAQTSPVNMPKESRVIAERLYDYLERFSVLLIDFRPREDFDQGHIFSRNIICIEPMGLRQGLSAEELANQLVLSPDEEQEMFQNRDKYDLVVYYDAQTQSDSFRSHPGNFAETQLKYLHEALYEFNQEKRLQRPPILLIGGLESWVDLMGNQALMVTTTQAKSKPGRSIQRRPQARIGQVKSPKRRLRDYNPLDAEEEQRWRDRAKSESMPEAPAMTQVSDDDTEEDASGILQKDPNIDEFNARFPNAGNLAHALRETPSRPSPRPPSKIPQYPSSPVHSVYPPVPARPAPAAPRMSYTGVSDRAVSLGTPVARSASQLLPYVPQKYLAQNLRMPRTGIHNFGNTCYMNATLQALSATTPLTILVSDDQYKKLVQKDNWKGSRGLLPEIYANTIRSLWQGGLKYIKPSTLLTFCGRLNSTFKDPGQQQDAQEFFSFLVDCLHEDFNSVWSKAPLRVLTQQEEMKRERMPKLVVAKTEWARYIHRENSFITSLFYGQHSSRLRCPQCNFTSTTYEAWALLQVEIPECREAKLQDCLRAHFQDESLDDENQWTCPICTAPRRATKKLTMTRAPPFLVVALKRFKQNGKGEQRKVHTAVRFPLNGLDMEEFVLPRPSSQEAQLIATNYSADALKADASLTPPYVYDAYAVVRHLGDTTRSGHYTSAVKDKARDCWRHFNDTRHQDFQPETMSPTQALDNDQAYLIFYQRRAASEQGSTGGQG